MNRARQTLTAKLPTVCEGGIDAAEFRGSASNARSRLRYTCIRAGTHAASHRHRPRGSELARVVDSTTCGCTFAI